MHFVITTYTPLVTVGLDMKTFINNLKTQVVWTVPVKLPLFKECQMGAWQVASLLGDDSGVKNPPHVTP